MRKFKLVTFTLILALLPILQSCLDNEDNDYWVTCPPGGILAIGTMKMPNADTPRDFFIALDNGNNVFPADTADIRNWKYTVAEGQRVFVGYVKMEGEEKPGYENGKIFTIEDILTKDIIPLTEATADSIGDDRINVTAHALTKDYLTIEYQYLGSMDENKKHMLNLVQNEMTDPVEDDGYICLEFITLSTTLPVNWVQASSPSNWPI